MKKKALSLLLAATTVTTLLAGCGGKKEEAPAATTAASAEAESTAGGQPEGEIDKSQLITIYTNNGSEGRDVWLVDRAAEAGYNVQVVGLGASDVANRMIAEQSPLRCGFWSEQYRIRKAESTGFAPDMGTRLDRWGRCIPDRCRWLLLSSNNNPSGYYYKQ